MTDPDVFYQKQDFWAVPTDPTVTTGFNETGQTTSNLNLAPYYVLMSFRGDTVETFALILPFTPQGRQNMVAWMAAHSDPDGYGRSDQLRVPERTKRRRADSRCSRG